MPRRRRNRRRGNSSRNSGSAATTEQSDGETENVTQSSGGENDNPTPNVALPQVSEYLTESGGSFHTIDSSTVSLANDIQSLINDYGQRLQLLSERKGNLMQTSRNVRAEFDERLDKLQKELTEKVQQNYRDERKRLELKMQQCAAMQSNMDAARASAELAMTSGDPHEVIASYKKGMEAMKQSQDTMEELKKTHSNVKITHKLDAEGFENGGLSLGTIEVTRTKREFPQIASESEPAGGEK
ncbi:uncharacterized protein LOC132565651 [Ylistrum balloti]|uniref:uncharacterized protein LOC132565651 n=1 Tax=Ylistrum balloti TaxID=509963 RepID=UPI002905CC3E|nr:uncharacterized protein LOC132565651 [Ylistrum balloti]